MKSETRARLICRTIRHLYAKTVEIRTSIAEPQSDKAIFFQTGHIYINRLS